MGIKDIPPMRGPKSPFVPGQKPLPVNRPQPKPTVNLPRRPSGRSG